METFAITSYGLSTVVQAPVIPFMPCPADEPGEQCPSPRPLSDLHLLEQLYGWLEALMGRVGGPRQELEGYMPDIRSGEARLVIQPRFGLEWEAFRARWGVGHFVCYVDADGKPGLVPIHFVADLAEYSRWRRDTNGW